MGATHSEFVEGQSGEEDPFWPRAYLTNSSNDIGTATANDDTSDTLENTKKSNDESLETVLDNVALTRNEEMENFRKELFEKRKARQEILTARANELQQLKEELATVKKENELLKQSNNGVVPVDVSIEEIDETEIDKLKSENRKMMSELAELQLTLQNTNSELLVMTEERNELQKHIVTFRDVTKVTKEMLAIREGQLEKLKLKLSEIEKSLADRELQTLSTDLRSEYERQLNNIRNLRTLYEERARVTAQEKHNLMSQIDEQKSLVEAELRKTKDLEERIQVLEEDLSNKDSALKDTESQLGFSKAETRSLQAEMTVVNQLFSQMLLCGGSKEIDMDRLVVLLEENHGLLSDMAGTEDEGTSAMPRLLLDLVSQAERKDKQQEDANVEETTSQTTPVDLTDENTPTITSAEDIVTKLPKVWRVLMELLSHQSCVSTYPETEDVPDDKGDEESNKTVGGCCYNSVQTPTGPRPVLSVSKTYIRLKDLILEKKSLQKELSRLKQLNNHLETRLESQERRLGRVSLELSHTWRLVGRMQNTHRTLHTHEQILRYELQQKRKLLNDLKEELKYCREKWDEARQRNDDTEIEWKKLRLEFAARKKNDLLDQASGESGYSDEREGISSDDDSSDKDNEDNEKDLEREETSDQLDKDENTDVIDNTGINRSRSTSLQPNIEVFASTTEEPIVLEDKSVRNLEKKVFENVTVSVNDVRVPEASTSSRGSNVDTLVTPALSDVLDNTVQNTPVEVVELNLDRREEVSVIDSSETSNDELITNQSILAIDCTLPTEEISEEVVQTSDARLDLVSENVQGGSQSALESSTESKTLAKITPEEVAQSSDTRLDTVSENVQGGSQSGLESSTESKALAKITPEEVAQTNDTRLDVVSLIEPGVSLESSTDTTTPAKRTPEEVLQARDARLKRLEEQCKLLVNKVTNTSHRSVALCTRLEVLHEQYGGASTSSATPSNNETTTSNSDKCLEDEETKKVKTESVIKETEARGSSDESTCDANKLEE